MVITDVNQVTYNGDGTTTAWPFTFKIIDATDIRLTLINANGVRTDITSDYYVDMVNNTVYYPGYAPGAEPPEENQPPKVQSGEKLEIYRRVPVNQLADLGEKWPFAVIEKGLDKLTMLLQDIYGWTERSFMQLKDGAFCWSGRDYRIADVLNPVDQHDVANKDYVDGLIAGVIAEGNDVVVVGSVAAMKSADLVDGMFAATAGYHTINDGGGGLYSIRNATIHDVSLDDYYTAFATWAAMPSSNNTQKAAKDAARLTFNELKPVEMLDNGNVAELIVDSIVNVKQFGAYGDKVTDDTEAVQCAIAYAETLSGDVTVLVPTMCNVTTLYMSNIVWATRTESNFEFEKHIIFSGPGGFYSEATKLFEGTYSWWESYSGNYIFDEIKFESVAGNGFYVMPGYPFMRCRFSKCIFQNVDTVISTEIFAQSFDFDECKFIGGDDYLIIAVSGEGNCFSNCFFTARNGGIAKQIDGTGHDFDTLTLALRVVNSSLYRITANELIYVRYTKGMSFVNNVLERCPYVVNAEPVAEVNIIVENNVFSFYPNSDAWARLSTDRVSSTASVNLVFTNNAFISKPLLDATDVDVTLVSNAANQPVSFNDNHAIDVTNSRTIDTDNSYTCNTGIEILTDTLSTSTSLTNGHLNMWFYSTQGYYGKVSGYNFVYRKGKNTSDFTATSALFTAGIEDGTDLNGLTLAGTYNCGSATTAATLSNCPYTNSNFKMVVMQTALGAYVAQIIYTPTGSMFIRGYNGSWSDWRESQAAKRNYITKGTTPGSDTNTFVMDVYDDDAGNAEKDCLYRILGLVTSTNSNALVCRTYEPTADSTNAIDVRLINNGSTIKSFQGRPDNTIGLGSSSFRWKEVFAGTGTINTSDERLKDNIESISDAVLDAWEDVQWYQFQFKDAIAEKGEGARLHTGLIAQKIKSVFEAHNLDAFRYGLLCYDEWETEEDTEAGNRYSLRYEEALCVEAAYQRRRANRLEARIQALEDAIRI